MQVNNAPQSEPAGQDQLASAQQARHLGPPWPIDNPIPRRAPTKATSTCSAGTSMQAPPLVGTDCFRIAERHTKALTYSQLESLPCLLVLCEKGRMGDTFPFSFACLDFRVRSAETLSTMIQELGRLCRYPIAHSSPADAQLLSNLAKRKDLFDKGKAVAVTWAQKTLANGEKDLTDAGIGNASGCFELSGAGWFTALTHQSCVQVCPGRAKLPTYPGGST